ncbi:hypothetical protein IQ265_08405 [Nodosilinea sp. LEGE 06152]|nr:hypothetical protein [Nodosilinea sp. LEGE 06152]
MRLPQAAVKRLVTGLLQLVLLANRPARLARSGFVLPTTVLLVLMVVLTATALTYRSFTRSDMAISQREQQVISNAATPAIDRAKAKIEFLFQTDNRFPSGVPASDILADLMLVRSGTNAFAGYTGRVGPIAGANDPYTLPDETRVDINGDNNLDNAWSFNTDINGNGTVETGEIVVYSVLVDDQASPSSPTAITGTNIRQLDSRVDQTKADALITRTGPLATTEASPGCVGALAEGGWQVVQQGNNSSLQKNFQVNAFVANLNDANRTFETLEFQQSRTAARANKWGAWFRYDLEVTPGPEFNWNGAMHTDGSFFSIVPGGAGTGKGLRLHMISSHNSCLYSQEASEISLSEIDLDGDASATPGKVVSVDGINTQEFQGQAVRGSLLTDNTTAEGQSTIHVWNGRNQKAITNRNLTNDTDSVRSSDPIRPSDIAINPLALFTRDVTEHINPAAWQRDPAWNTGTDNFRSKARIINDEVARPFVDDFYRADNRWGPKPRYDSRDPSLDMVRVAGASTGVNINGLSKLTEEEGGFDGYWERQAIRAGLRLIVGERLELGNANGWNANPIKRDVTTAADQVWSIAAETEGDALYPAKVTPDESATNNNNVDPRYGRPHEYLQRKALRDNLAAVQGMTVYHYGYESGKFPAACMAMTAHPGTRQSILDSRTFTYYPSTTTPKFDFLNGKGTNGWEFQFPATFNTSTTFAGQVVATAPLGRALRNLAYFAGDPRGGAPSFPPVQDTFVHPYPYLSMWGDFSPLRRIVEAGGLDNATAFRALSPADQATVHSAACTLSLLAYNVKEDLAEYNRFITLVDVNLQSQAAQLSNAFRDVLRYVRPDLVVGGGTATKPIYLAAAKDPKAATAIPGCAVNAAFTAANPGYLVRCDLATYLNSFSLDEMMAIYESINPSQQNIDNLREAATIYTSLAPILRDRELGFAQGLPSLKNIPGYTENIPWNQTTGLTGNVNFSNAPSTPIPLKTGCNPNVFQRTSNGNGDFRVALALVVCSEVQQSPVRYPSLFYLFPLVGHGREGTAVDGNLQPTTTEEYFTENTATAANRYISRTDVNGSASYGIVGTNGITWADGIAAVPRGVDPTTWTVPATATTGAPTVATIDNQTEAFKVVSPTGSVLRVPFIDKGVYNGREQLNTRVLDIDIEALVRNPAPGGDRWLSADRDRQAEGVVYAFREDAVREDEIVRPKISGVTAASCQQTNGTAPVRFNLETNGDCRMYVEPGNGTLRDPPLTDDLKVSLKPVDFYADPARRAHGFRLRTASGNPADFSGPTAPGGAPGPRVVGMTFVTDNSVYIQGDFNVHSTTGTTANIIEEFTQTLYDGAAATVFGDAFYDNRTTLNTGTFATIARDHWRPVEILADAITILSGTFRDGAVEDGFRRDRPTARAVADSSYMNQNRPNFAAIPGVGGNPATPAGDLPPEAWLREGTTPTSPVWIDRNGTYYRRGLTTSPTIRPFYNVYGNDEWTHFGSNDDARRLNLQRASQTFVNATFISGLVPQRTQQGYGGLHNFVRFLEDWNDTVNLHIAGSFIQLNFSTNATGPFEHDIWQAFGTDTTPDNSQRLGYYVPPLRRWGYDVALLYLPPAPAARRFVNIGTPRSEYYRELPADDPYIVNLRCARNAAGTRLMPNLCTKPTT